MRFNEIHEMLFLRPKVNKRSFAPLSPAPKLKINLKFSPQKSCTERGAQSRMPHHYYQASRSGGFSLTRQIFSGFLLDVEVNTPEWERSWERTRNARWRVSQRKFLFLFALPRDIYKPSISNKPSFIQRLLVFVVLWSHTDDVVDWRVHVFGNGALLCDVINRRSERWG